MQACLPGKPESQFCAIDSVLWNGQRIVAYVSGNTLIILRGSHQLHQTITHNENDVLEAVAIDPATGKIATSNGSVVYIHRPLQDFGDLRWSLQCSYSQTDISHITCLSWGLSGELLLGGTKLALVTTDDDVRESWKSPRLANACKLAAFSHDASLVASTGQHDRLAKIWRRGFIGGGNERFDPVYLSHPATITSLRWRGRPPTEEHADVVLYTTCADGMLRVWTATEPHCFHILDLWTQLHLSSCIQPRSPLSPSPFKKRHMLIVDKWDFRQAVEDADRRDVGDEREQHTRAHLRDISSNEPEVCVVLDDSGNMSAWGLERVGCKTRFGRSVMNIGHAEELGISFPAGVNAQEDFCIFRGFVSPAGDGSLHVLAHFFDGRVQWLSSRIERLFDPAPQPQCVHLESELTGHAHTIQRLFTDTPRQCMISEAESGETIVWRAQSGRGTTITRQSMLTSKEPSVDVQILRQGAFAVVLQEKAISCWNLSQLKAFRSAEIPFDTQKGSRLSEPNEDVQDTFRLMVVSPDVEASIVTITVNHTGVEMAVGSKVAPGYHKTMANGVCNGMNHTRDYASEYTSVAPINDRFIAATDASNHLVYFERRNAGDTRSMHWRKARQVRLVGNGSGPVTCSLTHAALLDSSRTSLTVWNTLAGHCELKYDFPEHEAVAFAKWNTPGTSSNALAVILSHRVAIFLKAGYNTISQSSPWHLVKEADVLQLTTLPVSDAAWTVDDCLVVAAGSQLFGFNTECRAREDIFPLLEQCSAPNEPAKLAQVSQAVNSTLPTYHPQALLLQAYSHQLSKAQVLLTYLHERLKFWTEGDDLQSSIGLEEQTLTQQPQINSLLNGETQQDQAKDGPRGSIFGEEMALALQERLETERLPWLSASDQTLLRTICRTMGAVSKHQDSADHFGFLSLISLHLSTDTTAPLPSNPWRSATWALLSTTQDILLDSTIVQHGGSAFPWAAARKHRTPLWLLSRDTLLAHFESIARAEYTKSDDRDPLDCSLFYLALRKKSVLQGLWRMAHGHREREQTLRVLAQNFDEPRWRSAALKNAYALLGKRRPMYAAAWFLLANEAKSAVNVLIRDEVDDLGLAISVARVFDGDDGGVLESLIEETLLPQAAREGDRWKAVYGFLMLKRDNLALCACVRPLTEVVAGAAEVQVPLEARMWYKDDPSLLWAYQHLRDAWFKNPSRKGQTFPVSLNDETSAVKATARTYMRMGCGWLALDTLRTWNFTHTASSYPLEAGRRAPASPVANGEVATGALAEQTAETQGKDKAPPSMLEAFETPATAPDQDSSKGRKKVTEEPSASSILDNFDF